MGVLVKFSVKVTGGRPPKERYPDGPETSRRMAKLKRSELLPSVTMVSKIGLYTICSPAAELSAWGFVPAYALVLEKLAKRNFSRMLSM